MHQKLRLRVHFSHLQAIIMKLGHLWSLICAYLGQPLIVCTICMMARERNLILSGQTKNNVFSQTPASWAFGFRYKFIPGLTYLRCYQVTGYMNIAYIE